MFVKFCAPLSVASWSARSTPSTTASSPPGLGAQGMPHEDQTKIPCSRTNCRKAGRGCVHKDRKTCKHARAYKHMHIYIQITKKRMHIHIHIHIQIHIHIHIHIHTHMPLTLENIRKDSAVVHWKCDVTQLPPPLALQNQIVNRQSHCHPGV